MSPMARFKRPVAPLLAARQEGRTIPAAQSIADARPSPRVPGRHLLIETFGSLLSPLNETELQLAVAKSLALPVVLVCSSAVGAIGRALQSLDVRSRLTAFGPPRWCSWARSMNSPSSS